MSSTPSNLFRIAAAAAVCCGMLMSTGCGHPSAKQIGNKYCGMLEDYYHAKTESEREAIMEKMEAYEKKTRKEKWYTEEMNEEVKNTIDECSDRLKEENPDVPH